MKRERRLLLVPILLLAACGGPRQTGPETTALYAHRPDLAGVDPSPLRGRRILLDPGHGGRFDGVQGLEGTREADVNLGVGLYLWGLLRDAGADVHLTRASDRDFLTDPKGALRDDLAWRVHAIDSLAPEVFLSLHHNSNAALDRERNAIETYYKLDDEGPSYDLGRAIHARLAGALGIDEARLRPGNYFVLRGAPSAAVLGEASYLSNPKTESQLRFADKQRLEAEAYYLGLIDYFAHGSAAIAKLAPAGDTLAAGTPLRFAAGEPIDPLSAEIWLDGMPLSTRVETSRSEIASGPDLPAGPHRVQVRARLVRGNAARPWSGRVVVHATPARAVLEQEPLAVRPGGRARLRVAVQDAAGRSVGSGVPLQWNATGVEVLDADDSTDAGTARAVVRVRSPNARLQLGAGGFRDALALRIDPQGDTGRFVRCLDARSGRAVAGAWLGNAEGPGDARGWLALPAAADTLRVERPGYVPWRGVAPGDSLLRLVPLYGGSLHGLVVALDPGGDGGEPNLPGSGIAGADAAYAVCLFLRDLLDAGGARSVLVRDASEPASDVERVRRASRAGADWYLRVHAGGGGRVLHYPGSEGGERMARALAAWIARRGGMTCLVATDTRFVLQQTPCPAVLVELAAREAQDAAGARRLADALLVGFRAGLDAESSRLPPLAGQVVPPPVAAGLVSLDGAELLPVGTDGRFVFECVAPGPHVVRWQGDKEISQRVQVAGSDTTRVRLVRP